MPYAAVLTRALALCYSSVNHIRLCGPGRANCELSSMPAHFAAPECDMCRCEPSSSKSQGATCKYVLMLSATHVAQYRCCQSALRWQTVRCAPCVRLSSTYGWKVLTPANPVRPALYYARHLLTATRRANGTHTVSAFSACDMKHGTTNAGVFEIR